VLTVALMLYSIASVVSVNDLYGESNGQVTLKVKLVTPIPLERNIEKTKTSGGAI